MSASELARQTRRRANLRHLLQSMADEGIQSWSGQANLFAIAESQLRAIMDGGTIPDTLAQEIEWVMHRPNGWLDRQPDDTLDH